MNIVGFRELEAKTSKKDVETRVEIFGKRWGQWVKLP